MNSIEVCSTGLGRGWASRASMSSALESRHELLSPLRQNCAQPHSHLWPRHGAGSGFSPYWDPFTVSCVIPSAIDRLLITQYKGVSLQRDNSPMTQFCGLPLRRVLTWHIRVVVWELVNSLPVTYESSLMAVLAGPWVQRARGHSYSLNNIPLKLPIVSLVFYKCLSRHSPSIVKTSCSIPLSSPVFR
jgi:hypothetical protein